MYARGYECIWYFGDEFGFDTFQTYFYSDDEVKAYAKDHFEISGFLNNAGSSLDKNPISRMRNMMKNALTDKPVMPKMMVMCLIQILQLLLKRKGSTRQEVWSICLPGL